MTNYYEAEFSDKWTNQGDKNPYLHGGCFIQFKNGEWRIIKTTPIEDLNKQQIKIYNIEKNKIWKNGESKKGDEKLSSSKSDNYWAKEFQESIEKLGGQKPNHSLDVMGIRKILPTLCNLEDIKYTEKFLIEDNEEKYWDTLDNYLIKKSNF